ncbi:MAG: hydrogen gas-evolving membrane-bound hydrogenase subunit E [Methanobacterium sp.]|jgi:multisubunit Na+/H+ antiporter MnhB subunit
MNIYIIHYLLLFLILLTAIIAVHIKDNLSAIIAIGGTGISLTVMYIFLNAPDIAATQAVIEIVSLCMLAVLVLKTTREGEGTSTRAITGFGILFLGGLVIGMMYILPNLNFGTPLFDMVGAGHYLEYGVEETGAINLVTAIIMGYRGFDTLMEVIVILIGVIGATTILRRYR